MSCQCLHKLICWRHVVSMSIQTDLLETCRVSVYTNRFGGDVVSVSTQTDLPETSCQCLHKPICWRHVVSVSTHTDLLEKCRVSVYTNRFAGEMSCQCLRRRSNSKKRVTLCSYLEEKVLNILKTFTLKMKAGWSSETFSLSSQTIQQHMHCLRHIQTTRFFCGLSALSYFIVDLHHCLFSNTKHKSILLIIPTF
jgi:hypothetical protein